VAAHHVGIAREFQAPAILRPGGFDDEAWPCGAGSAWKRETCAGKPVVQALVASKAAGAASEKTIFLSNMDQPLSDSPLSSNGLSISGRLNAVCT
jgi:hypothetical protein